MIPDKPYMRELVDYMKKNIKKGYTKDSLKYSLINQGYSRMEVERALKAVDRELASEAPVLKTKPEIKHEVLPILEPEKKKSFWKKLFGGK